MGQRKRRLLSVAVLLITTLLLAACGNDATGSKTPISSQPITSASAPRAPDFSVSTGEETTFSLSDHQGEVVVLYFSFPG